MVNVNTIEASLLGWALVLIWGVILFLFKRFCLDKIKSEFLKYFLGMGFAYAILILVLIASERIPYFRLALQNWRLWITRGMHGSIILVVIPAVYSIFLIGKGYFKEGGNGASWKWKLKMMASMLFNTFISFFSLIFISFLYKGNSFSELIDTIKDSFQYIDWWYMLAFVAVCVLFVLVMWLDHKKHVKK